MDTNPLPNLESDRSDNGQNSDDGLDDSMLVNYVLRVTPHGKFTFDEFVEYVQNTPEICRYIIGIENDTANEHYHVVCSCDISIPIEDLRGLIRFFIAPFWVDKEGKCPRGFGNKQYNLQICKDLNAAVSYAVKLKNYKYECFDDDYVSVRASESYTKKRPDTFKIEYQKLCKDFQESAMTLHEFMVKFVNLKAQYGQQVVMSHAYAYALSNQVRRDGNADYLVKKYLSNIK